MATLDMATIAQAWLEGTRNYFEGLEILRGAGVPAFMLSMLEDGPDIYNTPALRKEIEKLAARAPADQAGPAQEPPAPAAIAPAEPVIAEPGNDLDKKLVFDRKILELFKEIVHLHGKLAGLPEGEELYQVSQELLIKNLKKQRLYDELHYFKTNGQWFDELPGNQPKPEDLEQQIKNARSNRAKMKSYLKNPMPVAKTEYYQNKIAEWDRKISDLESQRNG